MNKTVTINISGIIFHIEEDAYEKLSKYLSTIRGYFSSAEGRDEIMSDIEARIAELLKEKTNSVKQVVVMADVETVMEVMGRPEDFAGTEAGEEKTTAGEQTTTQEYSRARTRRVFRDKDNSMIGGVCSGIAAYFDFDPLWIRLVLAIMFFGFGSGLLLYIILWIIIPEAKTTAEKLEMRGEKVDINNISKSVKEGAEQLKNRVEDMGRDVRKAANRSSQYSDRFANFIKDLFAIIGKVITKIIGAFFVLLALMFTVMLVASLLGFKTINDTNAYEYFDAVLANPSHKAWIIAGAMLLIGVPALMLMYKGIKMLFNIRYYSLWLNLVAGFIWFAGLIMCLYVGINIAHEFAEEGRVKTEYQLTQPVGDTLVLKVNTNTRPDIPEFYPYRLHKYFTHHRNKNNRFIFRISEINGNRAFVGFPVMNIVPSETSQFELYIIKYAQGIDKKEAVERARGIKYELIQQDSLLSFNDFFSMEMSEKWRDQEVEVLLKVPEGKVIYMDQSLVHFIYDIKNVTDVYDDNMLGRRWKMTSKGLECIDCKGLNGLRDEEISIQLPEPPDVPEPPDAQIEDTKVKIDEKSIKIKSKDADVNIDKHGININTKQKGKEE